MKNSICFFSMKFSIFLPTLFCAISKLGQPVGDNLPALVLYGCYIAVIFVSVNDYFKIEYISLFFMLQTPI